MQQIEIGAFASFNIAIMVLAVGKLLHRRLHFLRSYNIPEPVTSGLLVSLLVGVLHAVSGLELGFNLAVRDFLLLYFFAGIGLNADVRTLRSGGWPLLILLAATVVYIVLQNLAGVTMASLLGLNPLVGLLTGSVSLVGGHGTAIAWGPRFAELHGVRSAVEIGAASATLGLILSALMGGPIARILIHRIPMPDQQPEAEALRDPMEETALPGPPITSFQLLATLFWLNMCLGLGQLIYAALDALGRSLPLFVCALFAGILLTNTLPRLVRIPWPAHSTALAVVSDVALGVFLAMSLMSLQLWTLQGLGGPLLLILGVQFLIAFAYALLVVFRLMGSNYQAAVICAGFGGFSLGATPTAMANMAAVTQTYGPAAKAFLILPLVSGFFVDIANSLVIQRFISWLT
ncbi:sodium/glutamate symporter [Vulcanococcus limneticus]|uniref:sodium/glutamate symporter n=1 Tax=Vulcanococcus limneticus TaxID=2170428 RepID=UPI000B98F568|nr:sodium/glutamate symporter [Vulcanococcus limneticus]